MKKKEIKMILTIILIGVLIIGVIAIFKNLKNNNNQGTEIQENKEEEKYVEVLEDGTKLNTSNKLSKARRVDGLEISGIQLTHRNGVSVLLATAKNISGEDKDMSVIEITLYDDKNNVLEVVEGFVSPVKAGESVQVNMGISADYANAYDFTVRSI